MAEKSFNVFKEEESRLLCSQYSRNVKEERPSGIVKPSPLSSDAKSLARESSDQEVEVGKFGSVDCGDVSIVFMFGEVFLINLDCVLVDFGETNTANALILFPLVP